MKCKCGTELPEGAKFCPECGLQTPKPELRPDNIDPVMLYGPVIKPKVVAEMMDIGINRLYEHFQRGDIPGAKKIGRRWRVSTRRFFDWLDGRQAG